MIERIWIVFNKEVVDNLRDRKTLTGALLYPLLGPFMMLLLFSVIGNTLATQSEKPLALPVVGPENAPALVQFLQQHGASIQPGPGAPEGEEDVVQPRRSEQGARCGEEGDQPLLQIEALGFGVRQRRLGAPPIADVTRDLRGADDAAVGIENRRGRHRNRNQHAVLALPQRFEVIDFLPRPDA